ncbi:hypothetical protein A3E66_04665 [Candidatus Daviesbacteria bacterium RIFCSPHIGHO2_12_FULL_37_16]|uniref:Uncharacterized protein n=3 Tax=Candidatus Daviesiibacteriota TaxID=1752718 RepID=A0A0G0HYG7_9BACT|nr:MAG: hypothetical protein US19_C0018G0028 [Candidatus Daviesbacteria bacterium GW2011_GWB1_36_5]KKQ13801.1 MAG: hypothetical protein US28_C0044G0004 [Candidatus Daviesbacteria bacterium GW2011_GWA1_36_8]OGE31545.1 MAG: hypothetical protein A3C99_02215 [Candidatus Daviesbacteria bacterium RIFCSPHIGHO2_02_FULL_37_9]OGE34872.1 MAG: hypothetical protein A3E66_04665 [Candidatus Daviesbacteria bacterium RIFCSPHIGHO2_12_FULL_37_16]
MYLQDLESAKIKIQKHFAKYPQASISAMFRELRKSQSICMFGDYSLIRLIVSTMQELGIEVRKRPLQRAIQQSPELKGQKTLPRQLLNDEMAVGYNTEMPSNEPKDGKTTKASSQGGNAHV